MRKVFIFIMLVFLGTSLAGFSEVTFKEKKIILKLWIMSMKF